MEVVANKYKVIAHCYCIKGGGRAFNRNGQMKPHEASSFSVKWFTKGLISGGLICSQYHLVAKECKTSRYITDRVG